MANYPQPPYGSMSFPGMPPPYAAPAPATTHQGASSDPRHAPLAADSFQYNTTLPGLNLQQPPYPPTVQPPYQHYWHPHQPYPAQNPYQSMPFPPPFIGQNGVPPPPPPPPPAGSFYPQPPPAPLNAHSTPAMHTQPRPQQMLPQQQHQHFVPPPRQRYVGNSDADKEDGELSEADGISKSPAVGAATLASAPRSVPQNQGDMRAGSKPGPNGTGRAAEPAASRATEFPRHSHQQPMREAVPVDPFQHKREEAKQVITLLHENNVTYAQLLNEGLDGQLLTGLYKEIPLPVPLAASPSQSTSAAPRHLGTNGSQMNVSNSPKPRDSAINTLGHSKERHIANGGQNTTSSVKTIAESTKAKLPAPLKTSISGSAPVKSAPSPIDRKDYIARLQAAKQGKAVQAKSTSTERSPTSPVNPTPPELSLPSASQEIQSSHTVPNPQNAHPSLNSQSAQSVSNTQTAHVLRSAKDFKSPLSVQASQPSHSPPSTQIAQNAQTTQGSSSLMSEAEKARKTELVRQKILALQAAKNTTKPATPGGNSELPRTNAAPSLGSSLPSSLLGEQKAGTLAGQIQITPGAGNLSTSQHSQPISFPEIPGLFMHSAPGKPTNTQPLNQPVSKGTPNSAAPNARKRPVASDFVAEPKTANTGPRFTRPLGQSPHEHDDERMIIEVSEDDESVGSAMDLDEDRNPPNGVSADSPRPSHAGFPSLRNLPALSNYPSRPSSARASSALSTPPVAPSPPNISQQELTKKTEAIAELRRKIAETERRRQEKEAVAKAAAQAAPIEQHTSSTPRQQVSEISKPTSNTLPEVRKRSREVQPIEPVSRLSSTPSVDSPDWKRQRRAEIESGLPSLDASLAMNAARMEQLRKEMEQIEADNKRRMQDKENLIKELESLGIDTEGMPHEELQAKKDEIVQQMETEAASHADTELQTAQPPGHLVIGEIRVKEPVAFSETAQSEEMPLNTEEKIVRPITVSEPIGKIPGLTGLPNSEPRLEEQSADMDISEIGSVHSLQSDTVETPDAQQSGQDLSVGPSAVHSYAQNVNITLNGDSPMDDAEDFYSPQAEPLPIAAMNGQVEQVAASEADVTSISAQPSPNIPSEEGEVDMSESSSEEEGVYEPEEPQIVAEDHFQASAPVANTADVANPSSPSISSSSASSLSDDEELYEPPDVDLSPKDNEHIVVTSGSADVEGFPLGDDPDAGDDEPMSVSSDDSDSSEESVSEVLQNKSISSSVVDPSSSTADPLAPQLPPAAISESQVTIGASTLAVQPKPETSEFVPYESPLRMFKSYRYHPNYSQDVQGGFLSTTYSHQIDPHKPLCIYETCGGVCNDPHCQLQHFKDMALSDDKLLVQLGTANPGRTPEEKDQYREGLKLVIRELRQQKTQDATVVATQISKYRRQFLKDDSRVLDISFDDTDGTN